MITQEGHSGLSPQSFWKIQGLYLQGALKLGLTKPQVGLSSP